MMWTTKTLGVVSLVLAMLCLTTDGLTCYDCFYNKVPEGLATFAGALPEFDSKDAFGSGVCKDGGAALMSDSTVKSTVCEQPASGKKAVCMQGVIETKAIWDWSKLTGGKEWDITVTMYGRGCIEVEADEPNEGSVPASEFEKKLQDAFGDDESGEEESPVKFEFEEFRGKGVYCSTDSCGEDQDLDHISLDGVEWSSGVSAIFPSMLLVSAVALLARFF